MELQFGNRHDVLYNCARNILNQNIKRLFFKLNPFLERTDTFPDEANATTADAIPNTKFVLPLQSLVTSEKYFFDDVLSWKEFTNDEFWKYLYSEDWTEGYSLRVFEGQLLDYLLTILHVLEREKAVNRCRTFAYAKNNRKKTGCYKSSKEPFQEMIQETLLLEFNYYYRCSSTMNQELSGSSCYPDSLSSGIGATLSNAQYLSDITSEDEFNEEGKAGDTTIDVKLFEKGRRRSKGMAFIRKPFCLDAPTCGNILEEEEEETGEPKLENNAQPEVLLSLSDNSESKLISENIKGSLETDVEQDIPIEESTVEKETRITENGDSVEQEADPDDSQTSIETSNDSMLSFPSLLNLRKFSCTEATMYSEQALEDETKLHNIVDSIMYENEYYLADRNSMSGENISVLQKLRKRNIERIKERNMRKCKLNEERLHLPKLPKSSLESSESLIFPIMKLSKTLSFMEFLHLLWEEEKYDPRFRRGNRRTKNIVKRYKLDKGNFVINTLKENLENKLQPKPSIKSELPKIKCNIKKNSKHFLDIINHERQRMADEVGVVTDSQACRHHVLTWGCPNCRNEIEKSNSRGNLVFEIPNFILTSPSGRGIRSTAKDCSYVDVVIPSAKSNKKKTNSSIDAKASSKMISKTKIRSKDRMSRNSSIVSKKKENPSDTMATMRSTAYSDDSSSSSSESDDENARVFNTHKLNKRYSFEKIRGKDYNKKKSVFYEVLKKYCRVQRAAGKFRKISPEGDKLRLQRRRLMSKHRKSILPGSKPGEEMEVGVLRWYRFLQYRRKKPKEVVTPPDFSTVSYNQLKEKILKALGDFVVRKERVISDHGLNSSITVTFTRKEIFGKKNSNP